MVRRVQRGRREEREATLYLTLQHGILLEDGRVAERVGGPRSAPLTRNSAPLISDSWRRRLAITVPARGRASDAGLAKFWRKVRGKVLLSDRRGRRR